MDRLDAQDKLSGADRRLLVERLRGGAQACRDGFHIVMGQAAGEVEDLRGALEAVIAYTGFLEDSECEHGFHWSECPNTNCLLRDVKQIVEDVRD